MTRMLQKLNHPHHLHNQKVPVKVQGADRLAYYMMINPESLTKTPASPSIDFAGFTTIPDPSIAIPSDPIPATATALVHTENLEYVGWIAMEEELWTMLDWSKHSSTSSAMTASEILPLSQQGHTNVDLNICPFWIDTGASVHISPIQADFLSLKPIAPRPVKGLGGSTVLATGIGDIKLHVGKGTHLKLEDVRYIPMATIHLISVRCLTQDSNTTIHFDKSTCWITNSSSGATIAHGHLLTHKNLYMLTLHSLRAEHAFLVYPTLTINTWHRHLRHANYQSIVDMKNSRFLQGAPSWFSTPPPRCKSCVLGKQTRTLVPKVHVEGEGHVLEPIKTEVLKI